jgi:quercetin dioxygenase-like cupin family protein
MHVPAIPSEADLRAAMREKVEHLEEVLTRAPQIECPVRNIFAPGIYAREMTIPKGVVVTGAVHKTEHLNIVSKGHLAVVTDDGVKDLRAGAIFVSKPGAKKAAYAIEETLYITVHATDETDVDKLVELLTESTSAQLLGGAENKQLSVSGAELAPLEGEKQ